MSNDTYFVMCFLDGAPEVGSDQTDNPEDLHVTFLAHVSAAERFSGEIMLAFYDTSDETAAFELSVSGYDRFGKFGQHRVLTLADADRSAHALHDSLMARAQRIRGVGMLQPQYAGDGYSAHITIPAEEPAIAVGDSVAIDSLTLVRHIGGLNGRIEIMANATLNKP